jgi:hypothetical protein
MLPGPKNNVQIQQTKVGTLKGIGLNENHRLFRIKETSKKALGFNIFLVN